MFAVPTKYVIFSGHSIRLSRRAESRRRASPNDCTMLLRSGPVGACSWVDSNVNGAVTSKRRRVKSRFCKTQPERIVASASSRIGSGLITRSEIPDQPPAALMYCCLTSGAWNCGWFWRRDSTFSEAKPSRFSSRSGRYRAAVDEVRAKLFNYRLAHYEEVQSSQFDVPDLTGSTRQNARGLGTYLVNAPDLRNRLIALLRGQDESVRAEQSAEMSPVLESLLVVCHERRKNVHVGEIAKLASEILEVRGERIGLSPKEVGSKLKLLGLRTCRLDAGGRGLKLSPEICARIHQTAKASGVPAMENVGGLSSLPDNSRKRALIPYIVHVMHMMHVF